MKQADIRHTLSEAGDITHFSAVAATDKCLFSCASPGGAGGRIPRTAPRKASGAQRTIPARRGVVTRDRLLRPLLVPSTPASRNALILALATPGALGMLHAPYAPTAAATISTLSSKAPTIASSKPGDIRGLGCRGHIMDGGRAMGWIGMGHVGQHRNCAPHAGLPCCRVPMLGETGGCGLDSTASPSPREGTSRGPPYQLC